MVAGPSGKFVAKAIGPAASKHAPYLHRKVIIFYLIAIRLARPHGKLITLARLSRVFAWRRLKRNLLGDHDDRLMLLLLSSSSCWVLFVGAKLPYSGKLGSLAPVVQRKHEFERVCLPAHTGCAHLDRIISLPATPTQSPLAKEFILKRAPNHCGHSLNHLSQAHYMCSCGRPLPRLRGPALVIIGESGRN